MATPFIDFRPAQVMGDKEVYVCYYVLDPTNEKLKRMRIRCNRIKNRREQRKYASLICAETNRKLYSGWNPLLGGDSAAKKRVSLVEAAANYVRQKEKDLRKDSVRSYRSRLSFFTKWCEKVGISDWLCGRFTSAHAASLLDEYGGDGRSTYSYNSMLQFLKSLFRSFVSEGIASHNPFAAFKGKKREAKRRVTIPKQDRKRILNYFHKPTSRHLSIWSLLWSTVLTPAWEKRVFVPPSLTPCTTPFTPLPAPSTSSSSRLHQATR